MLTPGVCMLVRMLVLVLVLAGPGLAGAQPLALTGATLIDGTGRGAVPNANVVIDAGRIVCADGAAKCPVPDGAQTVALSGRWLTPGLIDAHVHLFFQPGRHPLRDQQIRFAFGITTTRDAGTGAVKRALGERRAAAAPQVMRPRLSVAALIGEWNYGQLMGGRQDPFALAAHLKGLGVDAIKLKDIPSVAAAEAIVKAGRGQGLPVFGHTWGAPGAVQSEAIAAGLQGVSHLSGLVRMAADPEAIAVISPDGNDSESWRLRKELWLKADPAKLDRAIDEMVAHDVWLEPSLAFEYDFGRFMWYPDSHDFLNPMSSLREMLFGHGAGARKPAYPAPFAAMGAFVKRFHERGGRLVASGDGALPGWDVVEEVHHLRAAGLSPMDALQCVTRNAAIAIDRAADLGTLEPGKLADLVVYGSDPLGPKANMADVRAIIKQGVRHDIERVLRPHRERRDGELRVLWRTRGLKIGAVAVAALGMLAGGSFLWRRRRARRSSR